MSTSTTDKLFSEATIGDVEAMLTRVFTNVALAAVTQAELEKRSEWECGPAKVSRDEVQSRYDFCGKALFAENPRFATDESANQR